MNIRDEVEAEESVSAGKGRIIKFQRTEEDPPNVSWVWIPLGNCIPCLRYVPNEHGELHPRCTDRRVTSRDFSHYAQKNTCPFFEPGILPSRMHESDDVGQMYSDVMRAAGILEGKPSEPIKIIQDIPWNESNSQRAHEQQNQFMNMAEDADSGFDNEPGSSEYYDPSNDLGDIPTESEPKDANFEHAGTRSAEKREPVIA